MFDPQVSYIRLLIGDNDRNSPFYTDTQIHAAATIGNVRPAQPIDLRVAGTLGKIRFLLPNSSGDVLALSTTLVD